MKKLTLSLLLVLVTGCAFASNDNMRIGYYANWSAYSGYTPDKIPAKNVDVINYAFANINDNCQIVFSDPNIDDKNIPALEQLKKSNPNLKMVLSVGGWNNSNGFYKCTSEGKTAELAQSAANFIKNNPVFDGVDYDWEFPVAGGCAGASCSNGAQQHSPDDRANYVALLKDTRADLDDLGTGHHILSIAGPQAYNPDDKNNSSISNYDLSGMMPYVDYINVMAYDYHVGSEAMTNNNAPLAQAPNDPSANAKYFNVENGVDYYLGHGATADKLVLGFPLYGYGWKTSTAGPDGDGLFTNGTGLNNGQAIPYKTIFTQYLNGDASSANTNLHWNPTSESAVYFDGKQMISFDEPQSLAAKAKYIQSKGLKGVMYWALDNDSCEKNSLVYQMSEALGLPSQPYACPAPGHSISIDNYNNNTKTTTSGIIVTAIYQGQYYVIDNYVAPNVQNKQEGPDSSAGIQAIQGKSGVQFQITPTGSATPGQNAFLCPGSFDFTSDLHVMAYWNPSDHACTVAPLK
tara:strand:- start:62408 stop:63961 length:1554 start_codon:yes stop_codon:yes gene_type:complete